MSVSSLGFNGWLLFITINCIHSWRCWGDYMNPTSQPGQTSWFIVNYFLFWSITSRTCFFHHLFTPFLLLLFFFCLVFLNLSHVPELKWNAKRYATSLCAPLWPSWSRSTPKQIEIVKLTFTNDLIRIDFEFWIPSLNLAETWNGENVRLLIRHGIVQFGQLGQTLKRSVTSRFLLENSRKCGMKHSYLINHCLTFRLEVNEVLINISSLKSAENE